MNHGLPAIIGNMFKKSFVVMSFPRTGSTLIIGNINRYFEVDAIQTHNPNFVPPHEDFTCIITKRNDLFNLFCSQLIMDHTRESHAYSNKTIQPFCADPKKLNGYWAAYHDFYQTRNLALYKKIIEIEFENLISDPYYLFGQFNIVEQTTYDQNGRSPYRYQDLITNLDELLEVYNYNIDCQSKATE